MKIEIMSDPSLAQVALGLAQGVVAEQESQVRDTRARSAPVLAAAAAVAGLLAKPALARHDGAFRHSTPHWIAIGVGAVGVLVVALNAARVLRSRKLAFTLDPVRFYREAYADRANPDLYLGRLASTLRDRALLNRKAIRPLHRALNWMLVGLGLQLAGLVAAVALA